MPDIQANLELELDATLQARFPPEDQIPSDLQASSQAATNMLLAMRALILRNGDGGRIEAEVTSSTARCAQAVDGVPKNASADAMRALILNRRTIFDARKQVRMVLDAVEFVTQPLLTDAVDVMDGWLRWVARKRQEPQGQEEQQLPELASIFFTGVPGMDEQYNKTRDAIADLIMTNNNMATAIAQLRATFLYNINDKPSQDPTLLQCAQDLKKRFLAAGQKLEIIEESRAVGLHDTVILKPPADEHVPARLRHMLDAAQRLLQLTRRTALDVAPALTTAVHDLLAGCDAPKILDAQARKMMPVRPRTRGLVQILIPLQIVFGIL